jgi:predicted DsbA family dithiol-disulfide isomerase
MASMMGRQEQPAPIAVLKVEADPSDECDGSARLGAVVELAYYTDPLCCWSWGFEPQWRRLRYEYGDRLGWRYRMAGMIATWESYQDPLNAISRRTQMGPLWMQARQVSGMPIDDRIWLEDPPSSSYPACLAVKAAELQSAAAGESLLRRLREAVMVERRNVARGEVILAVAEELASADPSRFNLDRFRRDLEGRATLDALREDIKELRYRGIGRFPALTLRCPGGPGVVIVGYRPYDALLAALARVAPDLEPVRRAGCRAEYEDYWGRWTDREVDEAVSAPVATKRRGGEQDL